MFVLLSICFWLTTLGREIVIKMALFNINSEIPHTLNLVNHHLSCRFLYKVLDEQDNYCLREIFKLDHLHWTVDWLY